MRLIATCALFACSAAPAQTTGEANRRYSRPEVRAQLGDYLSSEQRDRTQKGRELARSLDIAPGSVVADIGTGSGYMLPFFSQAVGSSGRVIAEDVFTDFLDKARKHAGGLANVGFVLGTADDPRLPAAGIDLAFMLDVYHHIDRPRLLLAHVAAALKPEGRLAVVDYYRREEALPGALTHIRADRAEVIREIEGSGFRLTAQWDHIPNGQYVLIFTRSAPAS